MTRPTLLIDGNNILIRAVKATEHTVMNSDDGTNTSGLVVVVKTISRYIREEKPYRVMVCWDGGRSWRHQVYPAYKAARPQQTDAYRSTTRRLVKSFLALCRIPQGHLDGFEADDLIAAHWRHANEPVTILSGDKDFLQLVGETPKGHWCSQIRLSSGHTPTEHWQPGHVLAHYGCSPAQLPLVMSLTGDGSDGIPGVKGIGPKFAIKHLAAAGWDLAAVEHSGIAEARDNGEIAKWRTLVDLREVPYEMIPTGVGPFMPVNPGPDAAWNALWEFLERYQLRQFQRQLLAGELW